MAALFSGVGVALVTLFDDEANLDAPATAELAARLADLGVRAMLVAGTTGEAAALRPEERSEVVAAVRAAVPAQVPVIAGGGAPSGRQAAELTERVFDVSHGTIAGVEVRGFLYHDVMHLPAGLEWMSTQTARRAQSGWLTFATEFDESFMNGIW